MALSRKLCDEIATGLRNLFVPPHNQRSAIDIHLHRLSAFAQWKTAAMIDA